MTNKLKQLEKYIKETFEMERKDFDGKWIETKQEEGCKEKRHSSFEGGWELIFWHVSPCWH